MVSSNATNSHFKCVCCYRRSQIDAHPHFPPATPSSPAILCILAIETGFSVNDGDDDRYNAPIYHGIALCARRAHFHGGNNFTVKR